MTSVVFVMDQDQQMDLIVMVMHLHVMMTQHVTTEQKEIVNTLLVLVVVMDN